MSNVDYDKVYEMVKGILEDEFDTKFYELYHIETSFKDELHHILSFEKRLDEIEQMVRRHSIGVQNVFEEMIKYRKEFRDIASLRADNELKGVENE